MDGQRATIENRSYELRVTNDASASVDVDGEAVAVAATETLRVAATDPVVVTSSDGPISIASGLDSGAWTYATNDETVIEITSFPERDVDLVLVDGDDPTPTLYNFQVLNDTRDVFNVILTSPVDGSVRSQVMASNGGRYAVDVHQGEAIDLNNMASNPSAVTLSGLASSLWQHQSAARAPQRSRRIRRRTSTSRSIRRSSSPKTRRVRDELFKDIHVVPPTEAIPRLCHLRAPQGLLPEVRLDEIDGEGPTDAPKAAVHVNGVRHELAIPAVATAETSALGLAIVRVVGKEFFAQGDATKRDDRDALGDPGQDAPASTPVLRRGEFGLVEPRVEAATRWWSHRGDGDDPVDEKEDRALTVQEKAVLDGVSGWLVDFDARGEANDAAVRDATFADVRVGVLVAFAGGPPLLKTDIVDDVLALDFVRQILWADGLDVADRRDGLVWTRPVGPVVVRIDDPLRVEADQGFRLKRPAGEDADPGSAVAHGQRCSIGRGRA
mmetsp:Transcript_34360/g.110399  ORF Transcript_34360/g.110399 Transcript_34360/m.110399 type:complete len:497 (-) Transcript_34360:1-1491(-)